VICLIVRFKLNRKGVSQIVGMMIAAVIGIAAVFTVVLDTTNRFTQNYAIVNDTLGDYNSSFPTSKHQTLTCFGDGTNCTVLTTTMSVYNNTDCASDALTLHTHWHVYGNASSAPQLNLTDATNATYICAKYYYRQTTQATGATRTMLRLVPMFIPLLIILGFAALI